MPAGVVGSFQVNIAAAAPQASLAAVADVTASSSPATLQVTYTAPAATTSYASTVLSDSPLAYYRLGEASGTAAADGSGNGHAGSYSGAVTLGAAGLVSGSDTAADFSGGGVSAAGGASFDTPAVTFEAWVRPAWAPNGVSYYPVVGGLRDGTATRFSVHIAPDYSSVVVWNGSTAVFLSPGGAVGQNVATHLAVTFDGSSYRLYVNGALADAKAGSLGAASGLSLRVGSGGSTGEPFVGRIDEAALYGYALTAARVQAHYNAGVTANSIPGNISVGTIDSSDLLVTAPGGATLPATLASVDVPADGTPRTATYTVNPPSGGWASLPSGFYTVAAQAGQVATTAGGLIAAGTLGSFRVNVVPPSASATAADITSVSAVNPAVSVKYTDDNAVNAGTLDSNDLRVVGPAGFNSPLALTSVGAASGGSVTASYTLTAPTGGWTASRNGTYYVVAQSNQVLDNDGNAVPAAAVGSFTVNIDATPPIASASVPSVTAPSTNTKTVTVTYTDGTAVNTATLGTGDVTVTGPSFSATPTFVSFTGAGGAVTATYTFSPPNSATTGWQSSNNGTYTINLVAGQVADTSGNTAAAASVGSFTVTLDTAAPTAAASASTVTSASASVPITVTYTDANPGVRFSTIDAADVRVTGPNAFNSAVTLQSVSPSSDGSPITATYLLAPPAGGWTAAGNGSYSVVLQAGQISDTAGNVAATATVGSFSVALDTTAPTATASAANITTAGSSAETFTVTFADAGTGVNVGTLGAGDVVVTGPGYNAAATFLSVDVNANGTPRTATYSVPAPAGGWANGSNGTYTIALQASQVSDVAGNFAAAQNVGSFQVAVPTPTPTPTPTGSYASTVLSDSPLAYYRLGEASGTAAADGSGNGHAGSYSGAVTLGAAGLVSGSDTAADFSGGGVSAAGGASFDTPAVTFEAWVRPAWAPNGVSYYPVVGGLRDGTATRFSVHIAPDYSSVVVWNGSTAVFLSPGGAVGQNVATHLAVTFDGSSYRLYVNGALADAKAGSLGAASGLSLRVGSGGSTGEPFVGRIDEAALYGYALTAVRVQAHYIAGQTTYRSTVLSDSPLAYYRLGEASGTAAADGSGNGHAGSYSGAVTLGAAGLVSGSDTAADFSGGGVSAAGGASFDTPAVTFEAWVRPAWAPNGVSYYPVVGGLRDGTATRFSVHIAPDYSSVVVWNGSTAVFLSPGGAVGQNVATHLAVTFDGSSYRLYVNGALADAKAGSLGAASGLSLRVGSGGSTGEPFVGRIDEAALYGYALTAARVQAHYIAGQTGS